jgi:hypothetical protein
LTDSSEKLSVFFAEAGSLPKTLFEYGWCTTDHKDGLEIRKDFRTIDYMKDEPYAARLKAMLEKLGLPFPKPQEIFRGTHHDLLFLNSHGVVVRIGPTDVTDLVNPGILQPLGWLEDRDALMGGTPFTVAIYPGIELYKDWRRSENRPPSLGDVRDILKATGQEDGDISCENKGIIRILDDEGKEASVEILLDPDNEWNSSSKDLSSQRSSNMTGTFLENKGDVLSQTLDNLFRATENIKYWKRAFEVHQPLRRLFWEAFKEVKKAGDMPDVEARKRFWEVCARVTNNPQATVMPVWHPVVNEDGKTEFIRDKIFVPQVILYRPWTGEDADKIIQPIKVSREIKEAIKKEYAVMLKKERSKNEPPMEPLH